MGMEVKVRVRQRWELEHGKKENKRTFSEYSDD